MNINKVLMILFLITISACDKAKEVGEKANEIYPQKRLAIWYFKDGTTVNIGN